MNSIGIVRPVDELGRIVIPMELRRVLGISEGGPLEIFIDEEAKRLMLRQYNTGCLFCASMEALSYFRGRLVCQFCLKELELQCMARLENAAAVATSETPKKKTRGKQATALLRLADVMRTHPNASQSEWARMIGFTPGYVNQLVRIIYEKGQLE